MGIKAIIFDLDDTLIWDHRSVQLSFEATCTLAAQKTSISPAQLLDAVKQEATALYDQYETRPFTKNIGINPFEALWANFNDVYSENFRKLKKIAPEYRRDAWTMGLRKCGVEDEVLGAQLADFFYSERRKRPIIYEETLDVLAKLKDNYCLIMLTNGSPDLQSEKLAMFPELVSYFEHIVISGSFGEGKPSPAIFEHVMRLASIDAQAGIMIGDKLTTDIMGALSVGMRSVWINRDHKTKDPAIVPHYEIEHLNELFPILDQLKVQ